MPTETPRRSSIESLLGVPLAPIAGAGRSGERIQDISLSAISPNPAQPRTEFPEKSIQELADSIKENGLVEPILVRPAKKSHDETGTLNAGISYELVAGERRLRAFRHLKRETIPAIVREVSDANLRILALIENLQREDLSVSDRATAIQTLGGELGGVEEAARKLGMSRANAFRYTRIAKSHHETRALIRDNNLDLVAADSLVSLTEKAEKEGRLAAFFIAAKEIVRDGLSVEVLRSRFFEPPLARRADKASVKLKKHAQGIERAAQDSPFWKTDRKMGLNLSNPIGKELNARERQNQTQAAEKYFRAIGAKRVEIRF